MAILVSGHSGASPAYAELADSEAGSYYFARMAQTPTDHADAFFARMLSGQKPTTADIDLLVKCGAPEGLHLDYKTGLIANKKKAFQDEIQREVAGFANSDGGVIVFGIREKQHPPGDTGPGLPEKLEGLTMGEADVRAVVRDALVSLRPYLSSNVAPEFLQHGADLLMVLAVARSDSLVLVRGDNKSHIHYLRIHDSTDPAPGYLVEDLILGRRRKTSFVVSNVRGSIGGDYSVIIMDVANTGLVWMDDVRAGLVGYERTAPAERFGDVPPILQCVDGRGVQGRHHPDGHVPSVLTFKIDLVERAVPLPSSVGPLQAVQMSINRQLLNLRIGDIYAGALFVVSRGQSPVWFQLVAHMESKGMSTTIVLLPLEGRRPIVQVAPHEAIKWCEILAVEPGRLSARWTNEDAGGT